MNVVVAVAMDGMICFRYRIDMYADEFHVDGEKKRNRGFRLEQLDAFIETRKKDYQVKEKRYSFHRCGYLISYSVKREATQFNKDLIICWRALC